MTSVGIFVGEDNWTFFREIFEDLAFHYSTQLFKQHTYRVPLLQGRLNRWLFRINMHTILKQSDICLFEWASELLVHASHMPKTCAIVTRLHSFELYDWAPKINWNSVDKVILVSHAMQQMFCDLYPDHAHKTVVIYNGRSLDSFKPPRQRSFTFTLGMLCNILPVKRIYEVILMLPGLIEQGYDARLRIAGEPKGDLRYAVAINRLVEKLNLQDRVFLDGYVADTPTWLQQIDIFISNSFWEGQQVALLEAMATGCYCLSHWWAGVEEMVPIENLYITETELRQKIITYAAKSASEKQSCQAQLRALACEKFDITQTKMAIRHLINEQVHCSAKKFSNQKHR